MLESGTAYQTQNQTTKIKIQFFLGNTTTSLLLLLTLMYWHSDTVTISHNTISLLVNQIASARKTDDKKVERIRNFVKKSRFHQSA